MTKIDLNTERMPGAGDYVREGRKVNKLFGLDDFCKKYVLKETKVLELGCNDGISTRLFCHYSGHVIGVDVRKTPKIGELIDSNGQFVFHNISFDAFFKKNTELFDVIYIDGAHDFESVVSDVINSLFAIKVDGVIAGHDFYGATGVPRAVQHVFRNLDVEVFSDSTWAVRLKPNAAKQILSLLLKSHPQLSLRDQGRDFGVSGSSVGHSMSWTYSRNPNCFLASLCDKYGSDKGSLVSAGHPYPWPAHTYTDYYARLWSHCRKHVRRVFECGLGTNNPRVKSNMGVRGRPGASLRVWRDYFPEAQVVGADIDKGILFQEDRIRTYYVDQLDSVSIVEMWRAAGPGEFDFMIDDGLHEFRAGISLFENSISRLSPQGVYVIEDVTQPDLKRYFDYFSGKKYVVDFISMHRPTTSLGDNSIVSIRLI